MRRWLRMLALVSALVFGFTCSEALLVRPERANAAAAFARMTGGLGMGATRALYWDFSTFDPRLEPDCTCSLWPVPGGYLFSPEHRLTVWDPPEITDTPGPVRPGPAEESPAGDTK